MIVKISAIIEAYLQRENRLIIPSVGTLLKRKESGEIVFVEMLKKNDGKLVGLVAEQFGVATEEAEAIVEGYSEEIGRQIATSRKFIIDGVGVLLVGANGALDFAFNPFTRTIPAPESEPKSVAVEPKAPVAEAPKAPAVEEMKTPAVEEPKSNVIELEVEPEEEKEVRRVAEPAKPAAPVRKQSALYDDDEEDAPAAPRKMNIHKPKPRKKLDLITIIALIAVVLALLSLVWGLIPSDNALDVDSMGQYEMGRDFELVEE
ncbi:MAG: hypothetical protein IIX00_04340 [Tidjanibacter sp.]|nr:hypothetical protein [Tidjanibacter sp.]